MPRHLRITVMILLTWAFLIVLFLPGMRERLARMAQWGSPAIEEQARREVTRPVAVAPATPQMKAKIFWAAADGETVAPSEIELPLSSDPAERARQLLDALITRPPSEAQRTLPAGAAVLEAYVLPDGTAVLDFSSTTGASLPSGIRSERLAIESITRTLAANLNALWRVKILIQGQEADTLAGHVDLTGFFELRPPGTPSPAGSVPEKTGEGRGVRASR